MISWPPTTFTALSSWIHSKSFQLADLTLVWSWQYKTRVHRFITVCFVLCAYCFYKRVHGGVSSIGANHHPNVRQLLSEFQRVWVDFRNFEWNFLWRGGFHEAKVELQNFWWISLFRGGIPWYWVGVPGVGWISLRLDGFFFSLSGFPQLPNKLTCQKHYNEWINNISTLQTSNLKNK